MPSRNLFKERFLKNEDAGKFRKRVDKEVKKAMNRRVQAARTEQIEKALDFFRDEFDRAVREWSSDQVTESEEYPQTPFYYAFDEDFVDMKETLGTSEYEKLKDSMAAELTSMFQKNGFPSCEVLSQFGDDLDFEEEWHECEYLVLESIVKSFVHDEGKPDEYLATPRTGLQGKCPICLETNVKLLALTPCGHTVCVGCSSSIDSTKCPTCRESYYNIQGVFPN